MSSGEAKGWDELAELDPHIVCKRSMATFDEASGLYKLKSFCLDVSLSVRERNIFCNDRKNEALLRKLREFAGLTFIWYLVKAKDVPLSGKLVRPDNLTGGHLFSRGTHVLPLAELAEKYNDNIDEFSLCGKSLNAEGLQYGDASLKLFPVPRIPVTLILWKGDDEYPPRADLLFDSSAEHQVPVDILWSIAMMSIFIMM